MKPVEVEILMKDRLSGALDKAGRKVDELKGKATAASSEMDSQAQRLRTAIAGLTEQMEELRRVGQNASPNLDQSENMAGIEALEKQIAELESRLKQLDATAEATQTVPPELPAAKQQFNGLHMSIQQMAREMPSLAMGPQMFFLAISNNLPIFADEVKRARVEYDNLVKSGQKGVPVWKQILSSLFSWQTALTTGIMLLVMYGDEIIEWTKNLFSSKDGVDALKKALQEKNEVEKEGHAVSIRTRAELDNTLRELRDFIGTKEQEKNKVDELNRKYGDTFGTYKSLTEWYDTLIQKGNAYVESLFMQAKAQSYIKKAIEADEKANEIRSKGKEEYRPFWGAGGKLNMFFGGDNIGQYGSDPAETAFNKALQEEENKKQHYLNEVEWFQKEATRIFKEAGLSDYRTIETDDDTAKTEEEKRKQARRKLNDELLALEQQNQQDWLDLQEEGTQKNLDKASRDVQMFGTQVQSTTTSLRESSEQAAGMFRNLESGLRNLSSGNLKGIGQGVMQLDKLFNGGKLTEKLGGSLAEGFEKIFGDSSVTQTLAEGLGNSGLAGSIISAILSILDELATEGIGGIVAGLIDTVLGAVSGIIDNIFSLELFQQIGESLLKGAANILDALSFGGLGKLVGNGDSDPHLEEDMERLSLTNEALIAAIESLTDEIKGSSGQQATELYEKQMARLDEAEAHTREQMQRSASAYSNGLWGIGGKKSSNKKIDDAMSGNDWQRISEVVGRTIGEAADFWNLSSEEMAKVAREAPDLYAKIKDYADAGYKDAARYMDDYIAFAEQRKELEQAYYESITQVSFDSVYDSFIDMLMDMSSDWEDFSDDMSEYLMRALLKTKLDEWLKTDMEDWYATFGRAMSNGELTDEEIEDLNKQWEELVKKGLHIRDSISEATGYTGDDGGTTQSGKPGGFAAMSQEQGTKLEGLFVSGQMHWASIDERMQDVSEQMGAAVDHLRRIEENTGASAKHLGEIKDEIKKIVRDGLKMK